MIDVNYKTEGEKLTFFIEGRIDSANAPEIEGKMRGILEEHPSEHIIIDCEKLEYTTSAGLRVVLRLKQDVDDTKIINASREVYDILDMTGFTEMMEVERAYRVFSVEGCEVIGQGANGKVYRIDRDTIVKVYLNPDALPEIHRERELARAAFVAGVPTAIPYDVVRIEGGGYGSVFELLKAQTMNDLLAAEPERADELVRTFANVMKTIHAVELAPGTLPSAKENWLGWLDMILQQGYISEMQHARIRKLLCDLPE